MSFLKVTFILLIFAVQAFGQAAINLQSGFLNLNLDFVGSGARAKGMGNAYLAISDDINAGNWNPAGLYVHDSPQIGFGYSSLIPTGTSSLEADLNSSTYSKGIEHSGSLSNLSELVFVSPFRLKGHKFVGTFSYSRTYDEYSSESLSFTVPGVSEQYNSSDVDYDAWMKGGMYTINIGWGTRIYNNISMGIVANIYTGSLVLDANMVESSDGAFNLQPAFFQTT
ncbi:MAG: hypothetical protein U9N54_05355, partial [candidate division Zixibacteria bacterium]|nr:hypothetical protein [candidate division Zixibacteria bacterium]